MKSKFSHLMLKILFLPVSIIFVYSPQFGFSASLPQSSPKKAIVPSSLYFLQNTATQSQNQQPQNKFSPVLNSPSVPNQPQTSQQTLQSSQSQLSSASSGYHEEEKCDALVLYKTKTIHIPFAVEKKVYTEVKIPVYEKVYVKVPVVIKVPVKQEVYEETHYSDDAFSENSQSLDSQQEVSESQNIEPQFSASSKKTITSTNSKQTFANKNTKKKPLFISSAQNFIGPQIPRAKHYIKMPKKSAMKIQKTTAPIVVKPEVFSYKKKYL